MIEQQTEIFQKVTINWQQQKLHKNWNLYG